MQANDLVFVQPESSAEAGGAKAKLILIRLTRVSGNELTGVIEKTRHLSPATITFHSNSVVMNVGSDPYPGTVLGHDLRYLYRKTREIGPLGDVYFFTRVGKEDLQALRKGADEFYKLLKKQGLEFLLENGTAIEVVSKDYAGKWAGMYKHSKDTDVRPHTAQFTLEKARVDSSSIASYAYVLAHEFGHALHFQFIKGLAKADAAWIRAYTDTVRPVQIEKAKVKSFLDNLLSAGSVSGARGELPEEDLPLFRRVLKELATSAHITPREVDRLLSADEDSNGDVNRETLKQAWPSSGLMHHELHPSVTEYALKNYHELFAESFAFHLLGQKLPARIAKLMDKTIEQAKQIHRAQA